MNTLPSRVILHMDMDAFYASVEIRDDPSLKGKPLIIGALPTERGVVSTCSYEARVYGVHSGMSIKEAYRLCPEGIYMHGSFQKYHQASDQIHRILERYTDRIQYIALDEGYLDITGSGLLFGSPEAIGHEIKKRVYETTGLTCSIGIGYNPLTAKMASEEKKPDGFFRIHDPEEFRLLFQDRPVGILHGIGRKTAAYLSQNRIRTVGDLASIPLETLLREHGASGQMLYDHAHGIDHRQITAETEEAKSYSKEHTFQQDQTELGPLKDVLKLIARDLSLTLLRKGLWCFTVTLKIRYFDLSIKTRSKTLELPTHNAYTIYQTAIELLTKLNPRSPVRLAGISLSHPVDRFPEQISLIDEMSADKKQLEKQEKLQQSLLDLYDKYGKNIVETAGEKTARDHLPD